MIESYSDLLQFNRKQNEKLYDEIKRLQEIQFKIELAGYCDIDQILEKLDQFESDDVI